MASNTVIPLGKKDNVAAGTLVQVDATSRKCHAIFIQAWPANTGNIYIFDRSSGSTATGAGMVGWIGAPTENSAPFWQVGLSGIPNAFDISDYYFDAEVSGDSIIAVILEV